MSKIVATLLLFIAFTLGVLVGIVAERTVCARMNPSGTWD